MAGLKKYCDQLMKGMENLITEEQKETFLNEVVNVTAESLEGFQQLREHIKNVVSTRQEAEEVMNRLENAFVEFQTNVETNQDRRRQQTENVFYKVETLLEEFRRIEADVSEKEELILKTENLRGRISTLMENQVPLPQEIIYEMKELYTLYSKFNSAKSLEIKGIVDEILQIFTSLNKGLVKKY
ncbi:TNFAIP3-interacting protein 1-like [Halyomorpha halys]|uniref:TNFAIP3-interacting protein 1-like n=1 Tax=Halyomorpha halys TaxID=286706 RepID=UPI0034D240F6